MAVKRKDYHIAKIVPFEFAADFLLNNTLFFSRPSTWDDPFEKLNDKLGDKAVFAQCWCKSAYSDAMWRIFSQSRSLRNNGPGIQIRTSVSSLSEAIQSAISHKNFSLRHKSIEYKKLCYFQQALQNDSSKLQFVKRKAFQHEKEYRFILLTSDDSYKKLEYKNGIKIKLKIDAKNIIDSLWIDPFSSPYLTKAIKKFFSDYNIDCKQSTIYCEPDDKLRLNTLY